MPEFGAVKGWKNRVRIGLESAPNESIWHDGRDPLLNSLTMDTSVDIDKVFVVGSRDAVSMIEGVQEVTGTLERNLYSKNATYNEFIYAGNNSHLDLLAATGMYGESLQSCKILMNTTSSSDSADYNRVIYGVKFHSYRTSTAAGDLVTESVDYDATNISTH
ncbi:MAG TPA: hypothetical protein ENF58_03025 [Candidatus Altiarchaeales archaeon]|nr:hypothetical protein [Candidatus Altiarchaeales archaeon]